MCLSLFTCTVEIQMKVFYFHNEGTCAMVSGIPEFSTSFSMSFSMAEKRKGKDQKHLDHKAFKNTQKEGEINSYQLKGGV